MRGINKSEYFKVMSRFSHLFKPAAPAAAPEPAPAPEVKEVVAEEPKKRTRSSAKKKEA